MGKTAQPASRRWGRPVQKSRSSSSNPSTRITSCVHPLCQKGDDVCWCRPRLLMNSFDRVLWVVFMSRSMTVDRNSICILHIHNIYSSYEAKLTLFSVRALFCLHHVGCGWFVLSPRVAVDVHLAHLNNVDD